MHKKHHAEEKKEPFGGKPNPFAKMKETTEGKVPKRGFMQDAHHGHGRKKNPRGGS